MIRPLSQQDLEAVYDILCFWIEHSDANLSWQPSDFEAFCQEQQAIAEEFPCLVAEYEQKVIGFGYAHPFLAKEAYQFDAELTIYFRRGNHHHLASELFEKLETICRQMGFVRLISCTTASNQASLMFQKRHGFREFGRLERAGWKNGHWVSVCWLEKQIADPKTPKRIPLSQRMFPDESMKEDPSD